MIDKEALQRLDDKLKRASMEGLWVKPSRADMATYSKDPHTSVLPHVWKWQDIFEGIKTVGEMHGLDGMAERRVLRLVNPAFQDLENRRQRTTTHTMLMTVQLLKPGEIASSHRHNFAAFRFILKGRGAYTVVEGEKIAMEEGDLILTPPMTWHGHGNEREPVIWIDGLDNPLLFLLQAITWEPYPDKVQPIKDASELTEHRVGAARPMWETEGRAPYTLVYKWQDTYQTLKSLAAAKASPFDGVALEYVSPNGGHTMPTLACRIQMLRPEEITRTHRHNCSTIYHAFRGSGTTIIDGQKFEWSQGDCFVVPLWSWHSHQNPSKEEAILFSMSDQPVMEALKLYREEAGEGA
jgi:gentisate 1,2-dioxygenase